MFAPGASKATRRVTLSASRLRTEGSSSPAQTAVAAAQLGNARAGYSRVEDYPDQRPGFGASYGLHVFGDAAPGAVGLFRSIAVPARHAPGDAKVANRAARDQRFGVKPASPRNTSSAYFRSGAAFKQAAQGLIVDSCPAGV